jgi:hypothetical protein
MYGTCSLQQSSKIPNRAAHELFMLAQSIPEVIKPRNIQTIASKLWTLSLCICTLQHGLLHYSCIMLKHLIGICMT